MTTGIMPVRSANALGTGAVYVGAGTLAIVAGEPVQLNSAYTQIAAGTLAVTLGEENAGLLVTSSDAALAGQLTVHFAQGYVPRAGNTYTVLRAGKVHGQFADVTAAGFKATPVYGPDSVQVRLNALN